MQYSKGLRFLIPRLENADSLAQRRTIPMSSSSMPLVDPVTMSGTGQPPASKASSPIELLPSSIAPIFSQIHPALLLSAYYLRFPALVADPKATLLNSLAPLAIVQMSYAVICLPATGTGARPPKRTKPGAKKTTNDASSAAPLVSWSFEIDF